MPYVSYVLHNNFVFKAVLCHDGLLWLFISALKFYTSFMMKRESYSCIRYPASVKIVKKENNM